MQISDKNCVSNDAQILKTREDALTLIGNNEPAENTAAFKTIVQYSIDGSGHRTAMVAFYNPTTPGVFDVTLSYTTVDSGQRLGNTAYLGDVATTINLKKDVPSGTVYFTPSNEFDGFYYNGNKLSLSGDSITGGDGYIYKADIPMMGDVTITKTDFTVYNF